MDDYSLTSLTESKNEWCARLVNLLTHHIVVGIDSIFKEAVTICMKEDEENKYLMTFQNLLSSIPNWNPTTIEHEKKRIEQDSGCKYLEDLITCVHIIQLKALTCIRVGQKQKKIDINIPSVDKFIHNIYINVARKLYTNIYLFEKELYPLQIQKNKHEVEYLVKEAILLTIRDNIPVERILQCYMEENEEVEVSNEPVTKGNDLKESNNKVEQSNVDSNSQDIPINITQSPNLTDSKLEKLTEELKLDKEAIIKPNLVEELNKQDKENTSNVEINISDISEPLEKTHIDKSLEGGSNVSTHIDFSDKDMVIEPNGVESEVIAPKDIETLEKISEINNARRKAEEADEEEDSLNIGSDVNLDLDIVSL